MIRRLHRTLRIPLESLIGTAAHVPGGTAGAPVSLVSIFHYRGVNALAEDQTHKFGPGVTVVYDDNGAGNPMRTLSRS